MSFLSKFKSGGTNSANANGSPAKKDPNAVPLTPLEKHLQDLPSTIRPDGSDKFFGFENYGSTCYGNSIIQCLYYSAPFRSHVINFPPKEYLPSSATANDTPLPPRSTSSIPWPNLTSPARKVPPPPGSVIGSGRPEDTREPDHRKRQALMAGPVLDMVHDNSNRYGMEESLFTALKDIFDAIRNNSSRIGVVSPHKFLEILRRENEMFRSAMHQDAHEFLNLLLNEVVENVEAFSKQQAPSSNGAPIANGAPREEKMDGTLTSGRSSVETVRAGLDTRWVHDLFEGLLTSETRCLTCENLSQRDEPFLDLSVDLAAHTSVTSCLRKFSAEEMLCERNKFHCDNCGGLQEAEKRMKIKRLPRVLALHLKRFKYTEDLQRLQKLFHRVVYPFHLRLFNTTDDAEDSDRLYELYAVVVHIGGGPYHGHYVSIIKTQDRGWLLFDDELVLPVDKSYVLNFFGGEPIPGLQDAKQLACAYVLFYQETTLEAMLKEQETESEEPLPHPVPEAEPLKDPLLSPPTKNDVFVSPPVAPVSTTEVDGMEHLAHAVTAPARPLEPVQSIPAVPSPLTAKSRKERKAEEKEAKAAAKAATKDLEERQREASKRRVEAWRKQDEELRAVLEASKQSASEEAQRRGESPAATRPTGLSRFRTGSLNARNKPKFFGKDRDAETPEKLAAVPQEIGGERTTTSSDGTASATEDLKSPIISPPIEVQSPIASEGVGALPGDTLKVKKNRFSIRRKSSQALT